MTTSSPRDALARPLLTTSSPRDAVGGAGRLEGKVAVITGAAGGMGRATALRFLSEGARVVVADIDLAGAEETVGLARTAGHEHVRARRTDVTSEEDVADLVRFAVAEFGGLDCVFGNAGAAFGRGPLLDATVDELDRTVAVNLRGVFLGLREGGRVLRAQGRGGSLLATASIAATVHLGPPLYAAAKAAVLQLVKEFAVELGPFGIRVNAISPGAILTPMYGADRDRWRPVLRRAQPVPLVGEGEDIAAAAVYLASDDARFVSGTELVVDGGMVAAGPGPFVAARAELMA